MSKAAEFFQSDGIILTGSSTGQEANPEELENVRKAIGMNSEIYCDYEQSTIFYYKLNLIKIQ